MSSDDYDLDRGGSFSVAGWNAIDDRTWHDVEKGDTPLEDSPWGLGDVNDVTVHYVNPDTGADLYFTMHGPWDDWDSFSDLVEYGLDGYGVE